jgi:hypothetical protein
MTVLVKQAICVRANADDLKFLRTVTKRMETILGSNVMICELESQASHADAMLKLKTEPYDLALFFAHGGSDYLRGGEYISRATRENVETEKFLTLKDLPIFKDKIVFCMSCDSNGLAQRAIECGAIAFVGFDKIPFNRFDEEGRPIYSQILMTRCQEILAEAVKATLERFVSGQAMLDESVVYLRYYLIKRAIEYVRSKKSISESERLEVAAFLLQTKDGLRYHGQKGIRFEPQNHSTTIV